MYVIVGIKENNDGGGDFILDVLFKTTDWVECTTVFNRWCEINTGYYTLKNNLENYQIDVRALFSKYSEINSLSDILDKQLDVYLYYKYLKDSEKESEFYNYTSLKILKV